MKEEQGQFSHLFHIYQLWSFSDLNHTIWKRACPRIWKSNCYPVKRCCCVFLDASEELPVPPTWFNYADVRSQWELVKLLWLFSSRALRLSPPRQCAMPGIKPAQLSMKYSSTCVLWWRIMLRWLSACAFQRYMKIWRCGGHSGTGNIWGAPESCLCL